MQRKTEGENTMNDRHEQSRAAFEANFKQGYHGELAECVKVLMWAGWQAALDYAAEQQAAPRITQHQLEEILADEQIVDYDAIEDPHGYDDGLTELRISQANYAINELLKGQTKQPEPLTRPDRPGWWWVWHSGKWDCYRVMHPDMYSLSAGLWFPATPPPAPSQKEGER
jgi:hypothetical protein